MKPERWQQLEQLFHSALAREPDERAAFLDKACDGDQSLRQQIDRLLAAHEEAESFIERPAFEVEARGLAGQQSTPEPDLMVGEQISHYRIIASLGSGGMGQVFLAQDTTLGRNVALKLLPSEFTRDTDRVRRFQQEARAASALSHPNIVTIYEIGQVEDRHFIATEFIDGETLRQRLNAAESRPSREVRGASVKRFTFREVLNIAIQTADALAAAHEVGIVHRDIKPENIMVRRRDDYVKLLDFGLAKLTDVSPFTVDTEAPTRAQVQTSAGLVMGTVNYMSPEQARGEKVDERTDIWSLGVVIYEMTAGLAPFQASNPSEVIASILEHEPPPLARYARDVSEELERIVSKALTKQKEERYQTAKDLLVDLRRLRQRMEVEKEIDRFATLGSARDVAGTTTEAQKAPPETTDESALRTKLEQALQTSSAEYLISEIKRHKSGALVVLIAAASLMIGLAIGAYRFLGRNRPVAAGPFQAINITRLTNTGNATYAAISPDGMYAAYVTNEAGHESLWVRHISTSSNVQIVPPEAEATYYGPTFSPDGGYVYYLKQKKNELVAMLYQIPVLGGSSKKIIADVDGQVAFSSDGKQIAFVRLTTKEETYLMVANADGSEVRMLATLRQPFFFISASPVWSVGAKTIFCAVHKNEGNASFASVIKLRVVDGTEEPFTSERWSGIRGLAGLRGDDLLVAADEQLWYLSSRDGKARRITDDSNAYRGVSVSEDARALVTIQFGGLILNIWVEALDKGNGDVRQVTTRVGNNGGPGWTPDGKIVYTSNASGNLDIWIMDQDGANARPLTANQGQNWYSTLTADGRYIVFTSNRSDGIHVWRMESDGSNPTVLTKGRGETWPYCSPDGKWVVYVSIEGGYPMLWRVPLEGGDAVRLTDKFSGGPAISPDGKLVAFVYFDQGLGSAAKLGIIPIDGGPSIKTFDLPASAVRPDEIARLGYLRWSSDGSAVTYVDTHSGVSNIWSQPLDGRPRKQLTDFKSDRIVFFDWSRDGKRLALARGTGGVNDVVLISESK